MMRYEDYSCWSRYLPLVNWITRTLGLIIEKGIFSPEICCRNVQFEIKLQDMTHTWCSNNFARSLNKAIRKKNVAQHELRKISSNFHVPSLPKWQKVLLIFRNVGPSVTEENFFTSYYQKISFRNTILSQKVEARLFFIKFLLKFCNQK